MAKIKKVELKTEEVVEEVVAEEAVAESVPEVELDTTPFATELPEPPQISPTVAYAIQQAQDRLMRDLANFPKLAG